VNDKEKAKMQCEPLFRASVALDIDIGYWVLGVGYWVLIFFSLKPNKN